MRRRVFHCEGGNVAVLFGLTVPLLLGVTALGVDAASINRQKDWMQNTADSVSLAVAKELNVHRDKPSELIAVGQARTEALLAATGYAEQPHSVEVVVEVEAGTIEVKLTMVAKPLIPANVWSENPVTVSSLARAYGSARLCVLGLNQSAAHTIKLAKEPPSPLRSARCNRTLDRPRVWKCLILLRSHRPALVRRVASPERRQSTLRLKRIARYLTTPWPIVRRPLWPGATSSTSRLTRVR